MRLLVAVDGATHEVEVVRHVPGATLGDLITAATGSGLASEETVWVDDHRHQAGDLLDHADLLDGSAVTRSAARPVEPLPGWVAVLSGGARAGLVIPVPGSRPLIVGRAPQADLPLATLSASWKHCTMQREGDAVRIKDQGSTNGTFVDGVRIDEEGVLVEDEAVITVGGATVVARKNLAEPAAPRPGSLHNLTPAATAPFNRPPRAGRPPAPEAVVPPKRKDIPPGSKFSLLTVLAPLVLAFAMVLVMGDFRYAAISALSPLLGVVTSLEQKHRRRKEVAAETTRFDEALDRFRDDLARAAIGERARMREDLPDPALTIRRAQLPSTQLWERRSGTDGFLALHAGVGDIAWKPEVDSQGVGRLDDDVREVLEASRIPCAPVAVDLSDAGVVGIVGDRESALAVARSLVVQAAVHCGPADLTIVMCCDPGREQGWSWTGWLPHVRRVGDGSGDRWVSAERPRSEGLLRQLRDGLEGHPTPAVLLVLDSDVLTEGRESPGRTLLGTGRTVATGLERVKGTQVSGIVLAASQEQLPAACTVIINADSDAAGQVRRPTERSAVDDVVLAGVDIEAAREAAMALAKFDDPELVVPGAALPSLVRLPPLLGIDEITADAIRELWTSARGLAAPVGIGEKGPFSLDLVKDGPHGLVGGTTGSGKSEFLRSLVAGLAARNDPTRLTFILVDFKGGAAFKTCERLPHTIGTLSNLDPQLANRAIRALEAEMEYRQRVFAEAGEAIDNLDAYLATNPSEPMPRLLLVIDEFAMLAKDYPDVLSSLVSVGAVGRTLGVHMILATQRPAGVVNDDILANTNLRVALRVQSRDDSTNVIGVPTASAIGRNQQGRAFVKLGQDDITPVQTALVTGRAEAAATVAVEVRPMVFGAPAPARAAATIEQTDLDLLIDAIVEANRDAGFAAPRAVWPEPLGERVTLAGFERRDPTAGDSAPPVIGEVTPESVTFALADDPDRQRQIGAAWQLDRGNLLLMGIPGSGTSTTLASIALAMARRYSPDDLDLVIMDLAGRDLAPLRWLPHVVGYVGAGSVAREQQIRVLKWLRAELDRRRASSGPHRKTVVLIDGLATLKDEYADFDGLQLLEGLYRAYADGPDLGLWVAASTTRAKAVPAAMDEVTTQKWLFRLADPYDYATAGIRPDEAPGEVAGRCVLAESHLHAHVATPDMPLADAVALVQLAWSDAAPKPDIAGQLPELVGPEDVAAHAHLLGEPWRVPVGIREADLGPASLEIYDGEHVLIAGPARSGKSTVLLGIADIVRRAATADGQPLQIWAACGRRSPLAQAEAAFDRLTIGTDDLPALAVAARLSTERIVLLIDDAETIDDADQALSGLLAANLPKLHVVAAGRAEDLRGLYSHWTKQIRKSRCGILLTPDVDFDGELLNTPIPRRAPAAIKVGRGYLCVGGSSSFLQCVSPV